MARILGSLALISALGAAAAVPAGAAPPTPVMTLRVNGEISALDAKRIVVDRIPCALTHASPSVGRFVLTDPVAITCRNGVLSGIRYAPETANETGRLSTAPPPAVVSPPTNVRGAGSFTFSAASSSSSATPTTVSGQITVFDGSGCPSYGALNAHTVSAACGSIAVGALTCTLPAFYYDVLTGQLFSFPDELVGVGQTVTLTCRDGAIATLTRSGLGS